MSKEIEITLTYEQSDDGVPVGPIPSDGVDMGGQDVEIVTSGDVYTKTNMSQEDMSIAEANQTITFNSIMNYGESSPRSRWNI